jgi:apolipoprotein N-acyltransferase
MFPLPHKKPKTLLLLATVGALSGACFAPLYAWLGVMLALGLLALVARQAASTKTAFLYGFVFSFAHHIVGLYWLPRAFWQESGHISFAVFGGVPALVALATYCALFGALAAGASNFAARKIPPINALYPVIFGAFWLGGELIRSHLLYGFPWNLVGYSAAADPVLLKLAPWGDVWLISLVLATNGAAICCTTNRRAFFKTCGLLTLAYGMLALNPAPQQATLPSTTVLLVQGNVQEQQNWDATARWQQFQTYLSLTEANNTPQVDTVIWPETAVMFLMDDDAFARQKIADVLYPHQTLITGNPRKDETGKYYNSLRVLNAKGDIITSYDKRLLVPFGEFVPLRHFIPNVWEVGRFVRQYVDYSPGTTAVSVPIGSLKATPLICYEAIFPRYVRRHAQENDVLLNITNDAWFSGTTAPHQHFAMARMRAAATGKPLIRVANTGITAFVSGQENFVEFTSLPIETTGVLLLKL